MLYIYNYKHIHMYMYICIYIEKYLSILLGVPDFVLEIPWMLTAGPEPEENDSCRMQTQMGDSLNGSSPKSVRLHCP